MILQHHSPTLRRRSAFTLLEILVVVTIIMALAAGAAVAVFQILKENKAQNAEIQANTLKTAMGAYTLQNGGTPPQNIQDILRYVEGGDPNSLNDPWGQPFQIGSADNGNGVTSSYIFTTNPETGEVIRSR